MKKLALIILMSVVPIMAFAQNKGYHTPNWKYMLETIPNGTFIAESKTIYIGMDDDPSKEGNYFEAPANAPITYEFHNTLMRYFVGDYLVAAYIIVKNDFLGCRVSLMGNNDEMIVEMYDVDGTWYMSKQLGITTEIYKGKFIKDTDNEM